MWNSFNDKSIVTSQARLFWAKATFIQAIFHKIEKRQADFFSKLPKGKPFQSHCAFVSIHGSLDFTVFHYVVLLF